MNKKITLVIALMLVITVSGCSSTPGNNVTGSEPSDTTYNVTGDASADIADGSYSMIEKSEIYVSFSEAVELSDCAVVGEYLSTEVTDFDALEHNFNVVEVLRGDVSEKTIHLFETKGVIAHLESEDCAYETGKNIYNVNEQYILVMTKHDSLFYEYPHYSLSAGDPYIPIKNPNQSTRYGNREEMSDMASKGVNGIKSFVKEAKSPKEKVKDYTTASDLPTIVSESGFILEINVRELMVEGLTGNCNTYSCDVQTVYKGRSVATSEDRDDIWVVLMKGSVEVGETYVVMVNKDDVKSLIYTQSSKKSVIPSSDEKTISEIQQLISDS